MPEKERWFVVRDKFGNYLNSVGDDTARTADLAFAKLFPTHGDALWGLAKACPRKHQNGEWLPTGQVVELDKLPGT